MSCRALSVRLALHGLARWDEAVLPRVGLAEAAWPADRRSHLDRNELLEGLLGAIGLASRATLAQLGHACSVLLYLSEMIIQAMA